MYYIVWSGVARIECGRDAIVIYGQRRFTSLGVSEEMAATSPFIPKYMSCKWYSKPMHYFQRHYRGYVESMRSTMVYHSPSIYLSIVSHCVFPVDIKYRICVCKNAPISTFCGIEVLWIRIQRTMSVTPLFLLNSSLAKRSVSSFVEGSDILLQSRTIVRHNARARPRWRNCQQDCY